jgi:2-alkenal reductase
MILRFRSRISRLNYLLAFIGLLASSLACQAIISGQNNGLSSAEISASATPTQKDDPVSIESSEPTLVITPPPSPTAVSVTVNESDSFSTQNLFAPPGSLEKLYQQVSPGVVSIQILSEQGGGLGSGFVIDKEGHIVTNFHVIEGADELEIDFPNGYKVRGTVLGTDLDSDLAILKAEATPDELHPLPLGDSEQLQVGQVVVAIGNPFGLSGTMTVGIVSAKGRVLDSLNIAPGGGTFSAGDIIQTDAAINPGNSGGPLLNLEGEVIGINRAIRTENFNNEGSPVNSGIGFAISVNILKRVAPSLISQGFYDYPYLGVSSLPEISLFDQEQLNLPQSSGALITTIVPGGPANEAGLQVGDLVTAIDGREILVFADLLNYLIISKSPGDDVALTLIRDGQERTITVTLGNRP